MKVPPTVDVNILRVYREDSLEKTTGDGHGTDLNWDRTHIPKLSMLCLATIADNWTNFPVSELPLESDLAVLLAALQRSSRPVPLDLLASRLHHNSFWKKAYIYRWGFEPISNKGRPYLQLYLERHCSEFLCNLHPRDYDPEQISELVSLYGRWVMRLRLPGLVAGDPLSPDKCGGEGAGNIGEHFLDMIPLGGVLSALPELTELQLSLGLKGEVYSRGLRRLALPPLRRFAAGIANCRSLTVLRITRSDIDCGKAKVILDALSDHSGLRVLDLSHCRIGEKGGLHLGEFLLKHPSCRELSLTNNKIGPLGAECLAYALSQPATRLLELDLRCNTTIGSTGAKYIFTALLRGTPLHRLNMSACGIGAEEEDQDATNGVAGRLLAAALASGRSPLRDLDVSCNYLGSECGAALLAALEGRGCQVWARGAGLGPWEAALSRAALRTVARRRAAHLRFRRGAGRLLRAKLIARAIGIDEVDPLQLARQLTARPSAASLPMAPPVLPTEEPLPSLDDIHIQLPPLRNPLEPENILLAPRRASHPGYPMKMSPLVGPGQAELKRRTTVDSPAGAASVAALTTVSIHLYAGGDESAR